MTVKIETMAEFYGAPYKPSWNWPNRPNQIPALRIASLLSGEIEAAFRSAIFDGLRHEQRDIADPAVLSDALARAGANPTIVHQGNHPSVHDALTKGTVEAYAKGVFGTPTFVWNDEIFFGADRLEVLAWKVNRAAGKDR